MNLRSGFALTAFALSLASRLLGLDMVRAEIGADRVASQFGFTGRGVLIAVLDRGIDYSHPDFRNEDGTTRIEAIFDLVDDTGAKAPGNGYGVGTLYTKADINAALANNTKLATRDAVGHGTTTAGLAAGNGRASQGSGATRDHRTSPRQDAGGWIFDHLECSPSWATTLRVPVVP